MSYAETNYENAAILLIKPLGYLCIHINQPQ